MRGSPRTVGRFPPAVPADIDAYPEDDLAEGFLSYETGDPEPGPNRAPGFRWGWTNRKRDAQRDDDGFDALRRDYLAERRAALSAARPGEAQNDGGERG